MEYKLYTFVSKNLPNNILFRKILSNILMFSGIVSIIIPLPFSVVIGLSMIVISMILIMSDASKVKYLIKIRKSILFLTKNLHIKDIRQQKIIDIKNLYRKIS